MGTCLAQHILGRHLAVLKHQLAGVAAAHAQLVQLLRGAEALRKMPFIISKAGKANGRGLAQGGRICAKAAMLMYTDPLLNFEVCSNTCPCMTLKSETPAIKGL